MRVLHEGTCDMAQGMSAYCLLLELQSHVTCIDVVLTKASCNTRPTLPFMGAGHTSLTCRQGSVVVHGAWNKKTQKSHIITVDDNAGDWQ